MWEQTTSMYVILSVSLSPSAVTLEVDCYVILHEDKSYSLLLLELEHWTLCYMLESQHYRDVHSVHRHWRTHTHTHTDPERLLSCIFFLFCLVPSHLSKVFGGIVMMMGSPDRDDSSSGQFSLACHRRLTHKCAHTHISEAFMHGKTYWMHTQTH